VNFLNVGSRETAQNSPLSALRAVSQNLSKLFNPRSSTAFGTTLQELEANEAAGQAVRGNAVPRQNLVAELSNSRAAAANPSGLAAIFGNGLSSIASTAGNTGPVGVPSPGTGANAGAGTSTSSSSVTPAAPPTPYTPAQSNSTDPTVYGTMDYSEAMNLSSNEVQANDENARRYQNYLTEFKNWQMNGSQGQPPQAPVYETVDQNGFQQWWAEYQANMASGDYQPPDNSIFLINGPDYGNGYYGATGSTQVGTLYNPTGPATADQIQSANNPHRGTNS